MQGGYSNIHKVGVNLPAMASLHTVLTVSAGASALLLLIWFVEVSRWHWLTDGSSHNLPVMFCAYLPFLQTGCGGSFPSGSKWETSLSIKPSGTSGSIWFKKSGNLKHINMFLLTQSYKWYVEH